MISISVNSDSDMYLGPDGNIHTVRDLDAVVQLCTQASQVLLGELPYAQTRGIPFFDIALVESPDLSLYEVYIRRMLLGVKHVLRVDSVLFNIVGDKLNYEAHITTEFGKGVVRV